MEGVSCRKEKGVEIERRFEGGGGMNKELVSWA